MASGPAFKGVLLDLWGTLVPTSSPESRATHLDEVARTLDVDPRAFRREWAGSLGKRCTGELGSLEESLRELARSLGREPTTVALKEAVEARLEFTRRALEAGGLLVPALDALRNAGLRLALVSDSTDETVRVWPSLPLAHRFQTTVFSCRVGFCKPDPRSFRLALDGLGLNADECAFVGDGGSEGEHEGAVQVGLQAFLFRFPAHAGVPADPASAGSGWTGRSLKDLRELLVPGIRGTGRG